MYPKTALKILLAVIIVLAIIFGGLYIKDRFFNREAREVQQIDDILNKEKQKQELTEEERQKLDAFVNQKVEDKRIELEKKTDEEIKNQGYTQDEVNFILDPKKTVESELGIGAAPENNQMTLEEIDAILNPVK